MKIEALRLLAHQDRVLVEVEAEPDRALDAGDEATALVIPEAHRRFSRRGRVLAVGCGHETRKGKWVPTTVQPGDCVLLPLAGSDTHSYDIDGREHRIVREREILATFCD